MNSISWHPQSSEIVLIANGEVGSSAFVRSFIHQDTQIVAVDGGLNTCEKCHLKPSLITGDFDSVSSELLEVYKDVPQLKTPDPNKTDLEKALEFLFFFSLEKVIVLGALGKRIDHSLTNINIMSRYPGRVFFETETESCFALPKKITLACQKGMTLSLIPIGEVKNIETKGLKWELSQGSLGPNFVGISNVCEADKVQISFEEGLLICSLNRT